MDIMKFIVCLTFGQFRPKKIQKINQKWRVNR